MATPGQEASTAKLGILGSELLANGKSIEVPEGLHVPVELIQSMSPTDAALAELPKLGQEPNANRALDNKLKQAVSGFASRMGMEKPPEILVASTQYDGTGTPYIACGFSKEGTPYIEVNVADLKTDPKQIEATMALEVDRLKHGDSTPAHVAEGLGNQKILFNDTFRADREASGPLGTCDPKALEAALLAMEPLRVNALIKGGAIDLRDPEHPPVPQRIARLEEQQHDQVRAGTCPSR